MKLIKDVPQMEDTIVKLKFGILDLIEEHEMVIGTEYEHVLVDELAELFISNQEKISKADRVIEELRSLICSGYDGQFIGPAVEPLFSALRDYDQVKE